MPRRIAFAVVLVAAIGASFLIATVVHRAHGSGRPDLGRLSNRGQRVLLTRATTRAFRVTNARVLAVRDGRAFYELETDRGTCFGVGPAANVGDLGGEVCPPAGTFPSSRRPVLDFTVYEGKTTDRDALTVYRVEGFAADGIAQIGVVNPAGKVSLRVPVRDNVYVLSRVPPGLSGAIVGLDADGAVVSGPAG